MAAYNKAESFAKRSGSRKFFSSALHFNPTRFWVLPGMIVALSLLPEFVLGWQESRTDAVFIASAPNSSPFAPLNWSNAHSKVPPKFYYPNPMRPYMRRLNEDFGIGKMTADAKSDLERVKIVCDWVSRQWSHRGDCPKQKNDPISILHAAQAGDSFSCYEYSMVAAACLNSIGIKSRIVVLLPVDVERRANGNYHVVAEAYLNNRKKWVMVDAQWNAIPTLNGYPLSIVELQNAILKHSRNINFGNIKEQVANVYPRDLGVYLHFLYTPLDNRVIGAQSPGNVGGGVMLVPTGEKPPRTYAAAPVGQFVATNSVPDFYGTDNP